MLPEQEKNIANKLVTFIKISYLCKGERLE